MIWNKNYVRNKIDAFAQLEQIFQREKLMDKQTNHAFFQIDKQINKLCKKLKID